MTREFSAKDVPRSCDMNLRREPVTKVAVKLREMLNEALTKEIQVSIQYLWQHIQLHHELFTRRLEELRRKGR